MFQRLPISFSTESSDVGTLYDATFEGTSILRLHGFAQVSTLFFPLSPGPSDTEPTVAAVHYTFKLPSCFSVLPRVPPPSAPASSEVCGVSHFAILQLSMPLTFKQPRHPTHHAYYSYNMIAHSIPVIFTAMALGVAAAPAPAPNSASLHSLSIFPSLICIISLWFLNETLITG